MKITFFIGGLHGGGAERVVCNLANYLVENEHSVQIVTFSSGSSYPLSEQISHITVSDTNECGEGFVRKIKRYIGLKRFLKNNKTDIYIGFLPVEMCMLLHFRKRAGKPVIVSERNSPAQYSKLMQFLLRHYSRYADGMVFQTEEAKEWYALPSNIKAEVIPNAINPEFVGDLYTGTRDGNIVAVGRLMEQKNFELLLRAYAELPISYRKHKLIIYGEGALRKQLEGIREELGLSDSVLMPGYSDNIKESIRQASLYVMSSDYEGMPNALMEAMALGLPCISTDCPCGGPRFLIHSGENGILVPVGDIHSLSETMKELLDDQEKAELLGRAAHKICEELAPDRICKIWEQFIQDAKDR